MARRVGLNPDLISAARENLRRWLTDGGYHESQVRALREWQPLLEPRRLPDLLRVMTDPGEEATRMRQSGPFAPASSPCRSARPSRRNSKPSGLGMERSKLAVILRDLREFMGEHPLIVAGSQSAHGQIATPGPSARAWKN